MNQRFLDILAAGDSLMHGLSGIDGDVTTFIQTADRLDMSICGCTPPRSGEILFENQPIQRMKADRIVRMGISQVPEGRLIFPDITVMENLDLGAFLRDDREGIRRDLDYVFSLFPILAERRRQTGGTLSGGEQQMLAISRALMARPRLLLLDEPSLGLAPIIIAQIFDIVRKVNESGTTVFLVEQNANQALKIAHRAYVMENGRVTLEGPVETLLANEDVKKTYPTQIGRASCRERV